METARRIMDEAEVQGAAETGALFAEHGVALARVCMALLGDAKRVEGALEQTAREASRNAGPPAPEHARAWLFGLARQICAAHASRSPIGTTHVTGPHRPADESPATERLGAGDAAPARELLAALKPTEREAVVLSVLGGLGAGEVAFACGVDEATARARIASAMARLVELGAGRGGGGR